MKNKPLLVALISEYLHFGKYGELYAFNYLMNCNRILKFESDCHLIFGYGILNWDRKRNHNFYAIELVLFTSLSKTNTLRCIYERSFFLW